MITGSFSRNTSLPEEQLRWDFDGNNFNSENQNQKIAILINYFASKSYISYSDQRGDVVPAHLGYQLVLSLSTFQ